MAETGEGSAACEATAVNASVPKSAATIRTGLSAVLCKKATRTINFPSRWGATSAFSYQLGGTIGLI
jgi:hypothetical protein